MWRILLLFTILCGSPDPIHGRRRQEPMENRDERSNLDRHDHDRHHSSDRETLYTFRSPWQFERDQDRYRSSSGSSRYENIRHDHKEDRSDIMDRHHRRDHGMRNEDDRHHHRHRDMPAPMASSSGEMDQKSHRRRPSYTSHVDMDHSSSQPRRYGYRHSEEMDRKDMKNNWSDRHPQAGRFDPRRDDDDDDDDMNMDMDTMNRDIMGRSRGRNKVMAMSMDRDRDRDRNHDGEDAEWRDPHMKIRPGSFKYVATSGIHAANHNSRPSDFERGWTNRNLPTGDNEHAETIQKSMEKMDHDPPPPHHGPTASALTPMTFADEERARFREQVMRSRSSIFKNSGTHTVTPTRRSI